MMGGICSKIAGTQKSIKTFFEHLKGNRRRWKDNIKRIWGMALIGMSTNGVASAYDHSNGFYERR